MANLYDSGKFGDVVNGDDEAEVLQKLVAQSLASMDKVLATVVGSEDILARTVAHNRIIEKLEAIESRLSRIEAAVGTTTDSGLIVTRHLPSSSSE